MGLPLPAESIFLGFALVLRGDLSQKELAAKLRLNPKQISAFLQGKLGRLSLEQLVEPIGLGEARTRILGACIETLAELDEGYFSAEELGWIESQVAVDSNELRRRYKLILRGGGLPEQEQPLRDAASELVHAEELCGTIESLSVESRDVVVAAVDDFHTWAFASICAEKSLGSISKNLADSMAWAETGCLAAERVKDESFRKRVLAQAQGHVANVLRVKGDHATSERIFCNSERLWSEGADPENLLDPGRLPELRASLKKDMRRPGEALRLLLLAENITRRPIHVLLAKASVYSIMGDYAGAVEILVHRVAPRIEQEGESRLTSVMLFNLAVNYCHLGLYSQASSQFGRIVELAINQGDELDLLRARWLQGRISAGLGDHTEAIRSLESAAQGFAQREMHYDLALALLESAGVLLEMGRGDEVRDLSAGLASIFMSGGIEPEAVIALRLFEDAASAQRASPEEVRKMLAFLFRVRHDSGLTWNRWCAP